MNGFIIIATMMLETIALIGFVIAWAIARDDAQRCWNGWRGCVKDLEQKDRSMSEVLEQQRIGYCEMEHRATEFKRVADERGKTVALLRQRLIEARSIIRTAFDESGGEYIALEQEAPTS